MTANDKAQMIANRVRKGYNAIESVELLEEVLATFSNLSNLCSALVYEGFISVAKAEKMQLA